MSDELQTPNTSSSDANETTIGGNITTGRDFIGRDLTVQGDQVQGDKITAGDKGVAAGQVTDSVIVTGNSNIIGDGNTFITQRLDPTDTRNQRNHATMRQLVRKFWIDGVLKSSLYDEVLIRLNVTEQPKAVDNRPWDLILQQPGQPNYALPAGTPIIKVFDQMNQRLLILGEPGSGKTTMLLELADALLKRAETDPTHPTPVVFNLSSWAEKRQPLAKWLVDELRIKYNIPRKVAQKWVEGDELLLLLDGLDEVQKECRHACVVAINSFRQEHFVPVVICSRVNEYRDLTVQLKLQGAVLIQPLTLVQINEYLSSTGAELSAVKIILREDIELQEMLNSPLLLSIMVIAYQGVLAVELSKKLSILTRRQQIFDFYIQRVFVHRGTSYIYAIDRTLHWLHWLSKSMMQRSQSLFLIERLQPDWLEERSHIRLYRLIGGLSMWSIFGLLTGLLVGVNTGVFEGLMGGLIGGLSGVMSIRLDTIKVFERLEFDIRRTPIGLIFGPIFGVIFGVVSGMMSGVTGGLMFTVIFGLIFGLSGGLKPTQISQSTYPNQGIWYSVRVLLVFGLSVWLMSGLLGALVIGATPGLIIGLVAGSSAVLAFGGLACIQHIALRTVLWLYNLGPFNYACFLDYCHDRIFLRKVGGGYIFIHRMLMEHFASLTDEDIKRIAADIEASK